MDIEVIRVHLLSSFYIPERHPWGGVPFPFTVLFQFGSHLGEDDGGKLDAAVRADQVGGGNPLHMVGRAHNGLLLTGGIEQLHTAQGIFT